MNTQVQDQTPPVKSEQQTKEEQRVRMTMLKNESKFSKSPIKPNITAKTIAEKYHDQKERG